MSDISDLFAKDPLSLTNDDRAKIIQHYRASRAQWNATGRKPPKAKEPKGEATAPTIEDLGEL